MHGHLKSIRVGNGQKRGMESVLTILEEPAASIFRVEERNGCESGRVSLPFQRKLLPSSRYK
jgi:hypothetical protein